MERIYFQPTRLVLDSDDVSQNGREPPYHEPPPQDVMEFPIWRHLRLTTSGKA